MSIADQKISRKLTLGFAVVVSAVTVMCGILFLTTLNLAHTEQINSDARAMVDYVDQARGDMYSEVAKVRAYLLSQNVKDAEESKALSATFKRHLALARTLVDGDGKLLPLIDALEQAHDSWRVDIAEPEIKLGADSVTRPQALAIAAAPASRAHSLAFTAACDTLVKAGRAWSDRWTTAGARAMSQIEITVIIGGVMAALLSAVMGWLLSRAIATPVVAMTAAMKQLAAGDNTVAIPASGRTDELGEMAGAVQSFKNAAIEKIRLESEAAEGRRLVEEERAASGATVAGAAKQQSHVVQLLAAGLEQLSKGDLVSRLTDVFPPEYEKLRADFNAAVDQLQEAMTAITANAQAIRSGTGEISQSADDLSRRTEQQAASLEQTAAALDQITATVRKTAEGASHARNVVSTAKTDAEHSGGVVRDAVAAMSKIEASSQQIGQIIGVIDEIAFQTNLLALNAGVEAARAGDAGKGFAVVASEVRALAQRSADAAKEIKTLISASGAQVGQGVTLVGETGKALDRIVTQVGELSGIVVEIAASAQEQATALHEVNTAVNQMDQMTQQNAAMVEQSTAASHALSQETGQLVQLVRRFQIGDTGALSATAPPGAVRTSARAPAHAPQVAMRTLGRGGAARKPQPTLGADQWEEF